MIQDSDYVLYKALARSAESGLSSSLNLINLACSFELVEYEKIKTQLLDSATFDGVGKLSNVLKKLQAELIKKFAIQDRIEKLMQRNSKRIEYISSKLQQLGIYNEVVDKKLISSSLSKESKNINEKSLNLNPATNGGVVYKFYNGEILAFVDDRLDLSNKSNIELLKNCGSDFYHEMIFDFPYCVATIPDECFLTNKIKNNVLKECVLYVASKIKTQSIEKSNQELGGMLENCASISNITEFAKELKNYLNVSVKQHLKKTAPNLSDEIDQSLRCNEASINLPARKRIAVLANGMAGDALKTEEQENEEIRKEQEKEAEKQNAISKEELLKLLLEDDEEEQELIDDKKEDQDRSKDEQKLADEKFEADKTHEEIEKQLEFVMKKNDNMDE